MDLNPAYEVLEQLRDERTDDAFATGARTKNPHALALGATNDRPSVSRLQVLRDMDESGATLATSLIILGAIGNNNDRLTAVAWEAIADHHSEFALNDTHSAEVTELVRADDRLDTAQRSQLINWLFEFFPDAALEISREIIEAHGPSASSALELSAAAIVGASSQQSDNDRLTAAATMLTEASQIMHVAPILGSIASPTEADCTVISSFLEGLAGRSLAIAKPVAELLGRIAPSDVSSLLRNTLAGSAGQAWMQSHLLPVLAEERLTVLIDSLNEPWWPDWASSWMTTGLSWNDHEIEPLLLAIKKLARDSPATADKLRSKAQSLVVPLNENHSAADAAKHLFGECLDQVIEFDHPALLSSLRALEEEQRIRLYTAANWRRPERAQIAAQTISNTVPNDLLHSKIQNELLQLSPAASTAALEIIAAAVPTEGASQFVAGYATNQAALQSLAADPNTRAGVFCLWDQDDNLLAFRALCERQDSLSTATNPLDLVERKARDYSSLLSPAERVEIIGALDQTDEATVLCVLLDDRRNPASNRPSDEVLVATIAALGELDDPELVAEQLGPIGQSYPSTSVRVAALEALSLQRPTADIAAYLKARESAEVAAVQPSASAAVDRIAGQLDKIAANDQHEFADSSLEILSGLRPDLAIPHARKRLDSPDGDIRRSAALVIGTYGDPNKDVGLLEASAEREPDVGAREAMMSAARKLTVGDEAEAHRYLGELLGLGGADWDAIKITDLYDSTAPLMVLGFDRVLSNRSSGQWGTAIDQLSEVAKYLLYRTIAVAGPAAGLKTDLVGQAKANSIDYGVVLNNAHIYNQWPWIASLSSLYQLRTEHLTEKNDLSPVSERDETDYEAAVRMFKQGMKPCIQVLWQNI